MQNTMRRVISADRNITFRNVWWW